MTDREEKRLVDLAGAGDQDALAELFHASRSQIDAVGSGIFRGPDAKQSLEDFRGDVWLLALKYLGSFRGESKFSTWILQIARHKALAIVTQRAQPKNGDAWLVQQGPETSDEQWESQCSAVDDRRLRAATASTDVNRLMETLSPQNRMLVQLHHLDGFTETEIAAKMGLSIPAVRVRLSRVLVQLRKKVEKGAYRNGTDFSLTK